MSGFMGLKQQWSGFYAPAFFAAGFAVGGSFAVVGFFQYAMRFGHKIVPKYSYKKIEFLSLQCPLLAGKMGTCRIKGVFYAGKPQIVKL